MMILSCKEASRLLSQRLDRRLDAGERVALSLHLALCTGCRRLNRQLQFLQRALRRLPEPGPSEDVTG